MGNKPFFKGNTKKFVASKKGATSVIGAKEDGCDAAPVGLGEGQSLISNPVLKKKQATEAYYNEGHYDEDQELALQILAEEGINLSDLVTPDISPEQMFELAESVRLDIPRPKLEIMADPSISFLALQTVNKAWKKGIDLTKYLPWADPFVLNQALLGAAKHLDLDKFIKPGLDHRQIEQMRKELEAGGDPSKLSGNYNEMRAQRFPDSNISNIRNPIPKGKGVSTHSRKKPQ